MGSLRLNDGVDLVCYSVLCVAVVVEQPACDTLPCLLDAGIKMGMAAAPHVPWGLWPRDWGSLGGRPFTHFFQLVLVVLVSINNINDDMLFIFRSRKYYDVYVSLFVFVCMFYVYFWTILDIQISELKKKLFGSCK